MGRTAQSHHTRSTRPSRQQYQLHGRGIPDMWHTNTAIRVSHSCECTECNMTGWDTCAFSIVDAMLVGLAERQTVQHSSKEPGELCSSLGYDNNSINIISSPIVIMFTIIIITINENTLGFYTHNLQELFVIPKKQWDYA